MSLNNLYLLRILQLEVYIDLLQQIVDGNFSERLTNSAIKAQHRLFEERKQIRKFLNVTELWRLKNA